jgi:isocitrate/isopropylmalate dehydrogenase
MNSSNRSYRIVAIPGEGIGPEVIQAALTILQQVAVQEGFTLQIDYGLLGALALAEYGSYFPLATAQLCEGADGIVLVPLVLGDCSNCANTSTCFAICAQFGSLIAWWLNLACDRKKCKDSIY